MDENEIVKTRNIEEALENYALKNNISSNNCDFTIEKTDTYIKDVKDKEFRLFNEDFYKKYKNKDKIINEHVELEQVYHILIHKQNRFRIKLKYDIKYDEYSTHPKIIINTNSRIPYEQYRAKKLFLVLLEEINKIKARNRILINLFDDKMINNLKAFIKYLYAGKFVKKVIISLFKGIKPEGSIASRLILVFEEKDTKSQVVEVKEGEILIKFIKANYGKNGFNAYGKQVDNFLANKAVDLDVDIDEESIKILEDENRKLYISKRKGFVHLDTKSLSVDNNIKMEKLSRIQEQLTQHEDNDIKVNISQDNKNVDSVGEGVELISQTVHITGHVGGHSTIKALDLKIDGATHSDSVQFAKNAKINRHKGTLRCHEAEIKLLEGGVVHATTLNIEASLGGTVYAQDVTIGKVRSNLKVYALNSITIRVVSGEDNTFKINYKDIPMLDSKIDFIHEDMASLKYSLDEAKRHDQSQITTIQEQILKLKHEEYSIVNAVKTAKISIEKPFIGLNTIIFTIDKNHEIMFKTEAQTYEPFYLEVSDDTITLHPVNKSIAYG